MAGARKTKGAEKPEYEAFPADDKEVWLQLLTTKDPDLRLNLINSHLPFARVVAAKLYQRRQGLDAPFEDYLHFAVLALIQAVDHYDPNLGTGFKTYAQYRLEGAILNELPKFSEQHSQVSLITRLRKERITALAEGEQKLRKYKPATKGASFDEMVEMAVGLSIGYMLEGSGMYFENERTDSCDGYSAHAAKQTEELLQKLVELLPEREKTVVKCHYFFGLGFDEIAEQMQVSKGRVSQLHKQGLNRLKNMAATARLDLNL